MESLLIRTQESIEDQNIENYGDGTEKRVYIDACNIM